VLSGIMCSTCAPSYYLSSAKVCQACPSDSNMMRERLAGVLPFLGTMVGLFGAVTLAEWRLQSMTKSMANAAKMTKTAELLTALGESKRFCVGVVAAFQVLASSASSMPPNMPSAVQYVFTFVSFFNGDTSAVSYEGCGGKDAFPFIVPLISMIFVLVSMALYGLLEGLKNASDCKPKLVASVWMRS
jgi:hypothetical protein